jgi:exoribonuclease R
MVLNQSITDLLHCNSITIDNKGTKAMDDAISIEFLQSNSNENLYKIHIHIADITDIIPPKSKID